MKEKIRLEIWQLFTVFTTVLTILSGIVWLTSTQPRSLEQEFVYLDQTKYSAYITFTALEHLGEFDLVFGYGTHKQLNCTTHTRIPFTSAVFQSTITTSLDAQMRSIDKLLEQTRTGAPILASQSGITVFTTSIKRYSQQLQSYSQKYFTYLHLIQEVIAILLEVCGQPAYSDINTLYTRWNQSLFLLTSSDLLGEADKTFFQDIDTLLVRSIEEGSLESKRVELEKMVASLAERSFFPRVTPGYLLKPSSEMIYTALREFEDWQYTMRSARNLPIKLSRITEGTFS